MDQEDAVEEGKTVLDEKNARAFIDDFLKGRGQEAELTVLSGNKRLRDELIRELKQKSNLSVRRLAGLLGVNRGVVQRVKA